MTTRELWGLVAAIAVAAVALLPLWHNQAAWVNWRHDPDLCLIHEGLTSVRGPGDVLGWFTGPWVGTVPFWRPLTSVAFWLEYRAFGWEAQTRWMAVHWLSHLLAVGLLYMLAVRMSGNVAVGLGCAAVFALPSLTLGEWHVVQTNGCDALRSWKDNPDVWLACLVLGSALLALRGSLWGAVCLALLAPMVKEPGFLAVPALAVFLAWRARRWTPEMGVLLAVGAVLALVRWRAIGVGYMMGTNEALGLRMWAALAPYPLRTLASAYAASAVVGLSLAAVALKPGRLTAAISALGLALAVVLQHTVLRALTGEDAGWAGAAVSLVDRVTWSVAWQVGLWTCAAVRGLGPQVLTLAALYVLFRLPTTVAPQVTSHALYLPNAFGAAAISSAWWLAGGRTLALWRESRRRRLPADEDVHGPDGGRSGDAANRHPQ